MTFHKRHILGKIDCWGEIGDVEWVLSKARCYYGLKPKINWKPAGMKHAQFWLFGWFGYLNWFGIEGEK